MTAGRPRGWALVGFVLAVLVAGAAVVVAAVTGWRYGWAHTPPPPQVCCGQPTGWVLVDAGCGALGALVGVALVAVLLALPVLGAGLRAARFRRSPAAPDGQVPAEAADWWTGRD